MSRIRADKLVNKNATGGPDFPLGVSVTGIMTASGGFSGDGSNLTSVPASSLIGTPNITVGTVGAGNVTSSGTVSAVTGSFTGNVSIGGTLTYDDVSNVDSVGLNNRKKWYKCNCWSIDICCSNASECRNKDYWKSDRKYYSNGCE